MLPVRSTAPSATAWCVVGAMDRALYELLNIEVYVLLSLEVDGYDTASCPAGFMSELRRPLRRMLGRASVAAWNDRVCPDQAAAARLLRDATKRVDLGDEAATTRSLRAPQPRDDGAAARGYSIT